MTYYKHPEYPNYIFYADNCRSKVADYLTLRRAGSKIIHNSFGENTSTEFKKLDLVLQRRFCTISYPVIQMMLQESSKCFLKFLKRRQRFLVMTEFEYVFDQLQYQYLDLDPNTVIFLIGGAIHTLDDTPHERTLFPKLVFPQWAKFMKISYPNFAFIPKILKLMPNLENFSITGKNNKSLLLQAANFENLIKLLAKCPKLKSFSFGYFDFPVNWENVISQSFKNTKLEECYFYVDKGGKFPINVPDLYQLCSFTKVRIVHNSDYTHPVLDDYFQQVGKTSQLFPGSCQLSILCAFSIIVTDIRISYFYLKKKR